MTIVEKSYKYIFLIIISILYILILTLIIENYDFFNPKNPFMTIVKN